MGLGAGGLGVQAFAELGVKLDGIGTRLDRLHQQLKTNQVYRGHPASATSALSNLATNTGQLTNIGGAGGGPSPGMVWEVRRISFGPAPGGTANGGTLIVYRNSVEIARTPTVPNFLTFSGYELLVQPNENLYAIWFGAIVGGQLVVDISAVEYPVAGRVELTT
jgi:hypothetical protein